MPLNARVIFDRPQQEIAQLLRDYISRSSSVSLVAGFMTPEGVEAIAAPLRARPDRLATLVVGAATWRAFEALDRLIQTGVAPSALHVHLGHTRRTGPSATYRFYRYHPMLHSKVYLLELEDGGAAAFVGSHNLTGFALLGLNGEAGVLLEGGASEPEFQELRRHVDEAVAQAVPYDSSMKEAYSWWAGQFVEGLRDKMRDMPDPDDAENKRTVILIVECESESLPQKDDVIYFEIPQALGSSIRSLNTDVHIYVYSSLPPSPNDALTQLGSSLTSLWCKTIGLESDGGGEELRADWFVDSARNPILKRTPTPFQPNAGPGMEQVRVLVRGPVFGKFTYLFDRGRVDWEPLLDEDHEVVATDEARSILNSLDLLVREDLPWRRVRGLTPAEPGWSEGYQIALRDMAPESGSFILFSLRRRSNEPPRKRRAKGRKART